MQGSLYLPGGLGSTTAGRLIVSAVDLGNFPVLIFFVILAFDDVGRFQPHFASGTQSEKFLWGIFHKVFPFNIDLPGEGNGTAAHGRILRIVDGLHLLCFTFRVVGNDQFQWVKNGHHPGCLFVEVFPNRKFQ